MVALMLLRCGWPVSGMRASRRFSRYFSLGLSACHHHDNTNSIAQTSVMHHRNEMLMAWFCCNENDRDDCELTQLRCGMLFPSFLSLICIACIHVYRLPFLLCSLRSVSSRQARC